MAHIQLLLENSYGFAVDWSVRHPHRITVDRSLHDYDYEYDLIDFLRNCKGARLVKEITWTAYGSRHDKYIMEFVDAHDLVHFRLMI